MRNERRVLYDTWRHMLLRCEDPRHISYPRYGGKGIRVCEQWRDSFEAFVSDMGPRPAGHTIERRRNSEGYSPSNCRWATRTEQNRNKSDTRHIEFNGRTQTLAEWAREIGIGKSSLKNRIDRLRLPIHLALTVPSDRAATKRLLRELRETP